jgi:hypothetical protein
MTPAITSLLYASSPTRGTHQGASGHRKLSVVSNPEAVAPSTARKTALNDEIVMVRPGTADSDNGHLTPHAPSGSITFCLPMNAERYHSVPVG